MVDNGEVAGFTVESSIVLRLIGVFGVFGGLHNETSVD
jgi:hypothetical protein